jgi:hypothetical protein
MHNHIKNDFYQYIALLFVQNEKIRISNFCLQLLIKHINKFGSVLIRISIPFMLFIFPHGILLTGF